MDYPRSAGAYSSEQQEEIVSMTEKMKVIVTGTRK